MCAERAAEKFLVGADCFYKVVCCIIKSREFQRDGAIGMREKRVVIAGAGKIGRGYLAEVFQTGGYHITFLVHNQNRLRHCAAKAPISFFCGNREETGIEEVRIAGYDAYCTVTERQECLQAMMQAPYVLLPIYPAACADFGRMLAEVINERAVKNPEQTMDLILCVNFMRATQQLRQAILPG